MFCELKSTQMPIETRSNSALFRRAEQLKRWEDSETNQVSPTIPKDKQSKIKFSDGCVFLAACAASDTDEVERLLKLGTDINTSNVDGLTALHQACIDNNLEMVQFLVEHGCEVNQGDNEGWTPLHATASCGFLSIAKYLIEHGANVAAVNNDGDLPIDIAESPEMEEYLSDVLDEKAIDCDLARSEEERIMLQDAKSMLESGTDLNDRIHPRTGATPLHVASAKGYIEVLKLLIQGGADINAQDNDGWTPLHAAAHWGQKEACAILADNLVNMDIQNLAGQTCFDVAEPESVKLLEELKKKQTHMQKDRPDIQAILQRTSIRPPLKRRTSVTRMSGQEKSKSVMKDTKSERAQIENLCLPEEETEEDKDKIQFKKNSEKLQSIVDRFATGDKEEPLKPAEVKEDIIEVPKKGPVYESKQAIEKLPVKESETERIPSWKKMLRKSATDQNSPDSDVAEVTLKRPKKERDIGYISPSSEGPLRVVGKHYSPTSRDDESELQRKAHAKRVRETRRSTQGVLLEDLKSAELQYLTNTQQQAAKRQAEEGDGENVVDGSSTSEQTVKKSSKNSASKDYSSKDNSSQDNLSKENSYKFSSSREALPKDVSSKDSSSKDINLKDSSSKNISSKGISSQDASSKDPSPTEDSSHKSPKHISSDSKDISETKSLWMDKSDRDISKDDTVIQRRDKSNSNETAPSVTLAFKPKATSTPIETKFSKINKNAALYGITVTPLVVSRRRRPKRRSTGVVYLDSDDGQEEKEDSDEKENISKQETFSPVRTRLRYGSTSTTPDTTESSSRSNPSSRFGSRSSSLNEEENREYKRLYEETKKENEQLKEALKKAEEELEKTKNQLQRSSSQNNTYKSSLSETEKKERRALERRISEMEEEIRQIERLRAENEQLRDENKSLVRVISKLSK